MNNYPFSPQPTKKNGYGSAALIMGLVSVILFPFLLLVPILLTIIALSAIVLGILSLNTSRKKSAVAGIILGSLSLIAQLPMYASTLILMLSS